MGSIAGDGSESLGRSPLEVALYVSTVTQTLRVIWRHWRMFSIGDIALGYPPRLPRSCSKTRIESIQMQVVNNSILHWFYRLSATPVGWFWVLWCFSVESAASEMHAHRMKWGRGAEPSAVSCCGWIMCSNLEGPQNEGTQLQPIPWRQTDLLLLVVVTFWPRCLKIRQK